MANTHVEREDQAPTGKPLVSDHIPGMPVQPDGTTNVPPRDNASVPSPTLRRRHADGRAAVRQIRAFANPLGYQRRQVQALYGPPAVERLAEMQKFCDEYGRPDVKDRPPQQEATE